MSQKNSSPRVQARAALAADTLADRRGRSNVNWVALRAENARRAERATVKLAEQPREWLMRDVCSTPYATVIS